MSPLDVTLSYFTIVLMLSSLFLILKTCVKLWTTSVFWYMHEEWQVIDALAHRMFLNFDFKTNHHYKGEIKIL